MNFAFEVTNLAPDITHLASEVMNLASEIRNVLIEVTNLSSEVMNPFCEVSYIISFRRRQETYETHLFFCVSVRWSIKSSMKT